MFQLIVCKLNENKYTKILVNQVLQATQVFLVCELIYRIKYKIIKVLKKLVALKISFVLKNILNES